MSKSFIRSTVMPVLAAVIWGMAFVAQTQNTIGTFSFIACRAVLAFVFLLIVILIKGKGNVKMLLRESTPEGTKALWLGGVLSGVFLTTATFFQQHGLDMGTDAGKAGFITALYIVLVPLAGIFFGRKMNARLWIAVALAVIALYLMCVQNGFSVEKSDAWVFFAPFLFCCQILAIDRFSPRCDCIKMSCVQFLTSFILSLPGALLVRETFSFDLLSDCLLPVLYLGIFSSGIAYTLQIVAQKGSNPAVVSILLSMESVFSLLFGWLILYEVMSTRQYIGCFIMLCAVLLTQLPAGKGKQNA